MTNRRTARTTLVEQELVSSVSWFIRFRWIAAAGVLTAVWFSTSLLKLSLPVVPLYAIGVGILAYNAVVRLILGRLLSAGTRDVSLFDTLTAGQIVLDWVAMTALVHYTGGLESPAILYFLFHVIIAAILLSPRATYLSTALAVLMISCTAALEYWAIIPHYHVPEFIQSEQFQVPTFILGKSFFLFSTLFVAAYLASTLSSRLRQRELEVVELGENLQRAYGRLQTLYQNAEAVTSTLELDQVLELLVRLTAKALGVHACSIRLLDESGTCLSVSAVYGLSDSYLKKGDLLLDRNPLARQVLAGNTIITNDVTAVTGLQYPAEAVAEGIGSMLSAPLHGKNKPLGIMRAYSNKRDHFTPDDAAFISAIASQGSIAIENALAYRELSKLDEMKSKFVLTVTHELRSPASVVRSLLRTLVGGYAGALSEPQRDLVSRALRRADFLQTLTDDLLELAAGKSNLGGEAPTPVMLEEVAKRVVARAEPLAREKSVTLEYRGEEAAGALAILATDGGIDRIVNNLLSNAVKYTLSGGSVTVSLSPFDGTAVLTVADTGIGIPEDSLPHLFEEFYRAPNARAEEKEGTGLGLAITRDLVERYGGHISVQSAQGRGSTFTVTFPLAKEPTPG